MQTGWTSEAPEERPAMPLTERIMAIRSTGPGDTLAIAQARSRADEARAAAEQANRAVDPDEYAANLVLRGYTPGAMSQLGMRLADCEGELAGEREKIERTARRQQRLMERHANGQISAWDIMSAQGDDEGDASRAAMLERRAERLRGEIREAAEAMAPPRAPADGDPLEAASRRAHDAFVQATRAKMADAAAGRAVRPAPRPFVSRSGAVRSDTVTCADCATMGATPDESFLIHNDPQPVPVPEQVRADGSCQHGYVAACAACRTAAASRSAGYYNLVRGTEGAIVGVGG